jgi:hypothetical protein
LGTLLRLRGRSKKLTASMFDFSSNAKQKEAWLFLDTLWQGLEYLCQQVERVERERAKPDKNFTYVDLSSSPGDAMLCNYFLWYANVLYNFIGVFKKAFSPSEVTSLMLSYGALKLLPFWDSLRSDGRFEKIVNSLAPK